MKETLKSWKEILWLLKSMDKNRIPQINELIKQELGNVVFKEIEFPKDTLVTVTRVQTSSNLIQAKVYVSVMPESQTPKVLQTLNDQIFELQQTINKRLEMRPIPKIKFVEEKETRKAEEIEKLLEEIKDN